MSLLLKNKFKNQNSKLRNSKIFNFQFSIFNSRRAGFTLLEVLLSLALLSIILVTVYSSFFTVQKALERFDGVSLKYHEVRTALDIIRREIEAAFFEEPKTQNLKPSTYFLIKDRDIFGKPTSRLRLTAFSVKGSGLNAVSYFVEEKDRRLRLLKKGSPASVPAKEYSLEMIEGIEGFTVETLFDKKWVRTWDTAQTLRLPDIVRVSITFNDNGKDITLTEYAKPRIGGNF